jgi:hypothetical protein
MEIGCSSSPLSARSTGERFVRDSFPATFGAGLHVLITQTVNASEGTGSVPNPTDNPAKRQVTVPVPLSRGP